ncbi:MAG: HPr family phosphocarrier protein [Spirochaetia bacterium]
MKEVEVSIRNRAGLHARPATKIVQITNQFPCHTEMVYKGEHANAKSIMGIIALGILYKESVKIITDGPQEEEAMQALVTLFENGFNDDE